MHSRPRLKLAGILRTGLDEFAERWIKFLRANELIPETDEPQEEAVNRARLGFEVLANLLEGSDFPKYENVVRRLFHDWINRAATYPELLTIEEGFYAFIIPHLDFDSDSPEADEVREELFNFFHSDLRAYALSLYLKVYEDIIGRESRHTAYILAHFDAILSLNAHLNRAETRRDLVDGLSQEFENLFENVFAVGVWAETSEGLKIRNAIALNDDVPLPMIDSPLPAKIEELYDIGEVKWLSEDDIPVDLRSLIVVEIKSRISACAIPVRPKESEGLMILLVVGADQPGFLEVSLSRIASAECALSLDRVSGHERISNINKRVRDILALSRDTAWGAGYHETGETVIDYLLDLTGAHRALLLAQPSTSFHSRQFKPLSWRDLNRDQVNLYSNDNNLPPVVTIAIKRGKPILLESSRIESILCGKPAPPEFTPARNEILGILPLERNGERQGVCLFLCPVKFASEQESNNMLALFARTAADALATAKEYERSLKMAEMEKADTTTARILQEQLTPRFRRSGKLQYWAHLHPAGELAGDVIVIQIPKDGIMNIWAADVAGRGVSAAWSMMFIRQMLSELPLDTISPKSALAEINTRLHDIESRTSSGTFATSIGVHLDTVSNRGMFARAGAPKLIRVLADGSTEILDPDGIPLGLFADPKLDESEFTFNPGEKLIWVSDGVLATRNENGWRFGEKGIENCVRDAHYLPARALFEYILESIGEFAGDDRAHDDWSLIIIGYDREPDWVGSRPGSEKDKLLEDALAWLETTRCKDSDFTAIRLLLSEAIRNAHEHGNMGDENSKIEIRLSAHPKYIHMQVRDEGGRLNERVANPNFRAENILEDKGRGFLLMRHESDHLWVEDGNGELNAVRILEDEE